MEEHFRQVIAEILATAEQKFGWPLYVVVESADKQRAVFMYRAQGEYPTCIEDVDLSDAPFPFSVTVRKWDGATGQPQGQAVKFQVAMGMEEGRTALFVTPLRSTQDLITELDEEAAEHSAVMMAVGFEDTTIWLCQMILTGTGCSTMPSSPAASP